MFAFTLAEIGLDPLVISLLFFIVLFILISFVLTSKNMDVQGLLRVLYAKPVRSRDGRVEYRRDF